MQTKDIRAAYQLVAVTPFILRFVGLALLATILAKNSYSQPIELGRTSISKVEAATVRPPDFHGHDPLGANTPWFNELRRDISNDPANPYSDEMLARMRNSSGTVAVEFSGSWTPPEYNWYTFPWQVVSGNIAPVSVPGTWSYNPASTGPLMLPPEPIIMENTPTLQYYTQPADPSSDHHLVVYVRNEATGGFKELWEYYQLWVTKNGNGQITAAAGASWRKFDLLNGENPPTDTVSTDAAGLMIAPLLVRYDEVASGSINHVMRTTFNNTDISPTLKWPARTAAGAWNEYFGMPYGTRLRIKKSWWDANADSVLGTNTQARVIGEALRRYGAVVADGTSGSNLFLESAGNTRWEPDLEARIGSIPMSAIEVVDTPPVVQINGPVALRVSEMGSWNFTAVPADAPISLSNINIYTANIAEQIRYAAATIDQTHRSVSASQTFTKVGVYQIRPYASWAVSKIGPYMITVTDTDIPVTGMMLLTTGSHLTNQNIVVTVTTGSPFTGTVTVTPSGCGLSTPYQLRFSNDRTRSIGFTPTVAGKLTLTARANQGLEDAPIVNLKIGDQKPATSTYTLSLTGGGGIGSPVTATVIPDAPFVGSITLTASGVGVSGQTQLVFDNEMMRSVTFTPASMGTLTVTGSNNKSLANPSAATKTIGAGSVAPNPPQNLRTTN